MAKIALGTRKELTDPDFARSVLTELLLTFLFIFGAVGAVMTADKMGGGPGTITGLAAVAAATTMLVAVMIAVGKDASAGHLNPAVTIGFAAGGYVTVFRCVLYVAAQLAGSSMACFLLKYITGEELDVGVHVLGAGMRPLQGLLMELVLTFTMVFSIYAIIADPKKGTVSSLAPLLIGLVVGANTLVGGPISGPSMNPARSFGPALVCWSWADHWVYWAGPMAGSWLAGFVYDWLFLARGHDLLPVDEEAF
ncbi:hypothetical protein Cni_G23353 [Canna indica]|uniref:Uncharacterized protein n=1 Tax=Canna indica TaxID=4628 RepID=A0AAQ3KX08_9LILI|nr:hypothetical protein Cni_G23353 [Canna indica]